MSQNMTVYYDGLCQLCSREIEHYRKQQGAEKIRFMDITSPQFDPTKEGVDGKKVHKVMHVKKGKKLYTKVDAFIEIWKQLPKYAWAAKYADKTAIRWILDCGYEVFAKVRPYLPRKKQSCEDSPFCELKGNS